MNDLEYINKYKKKVIAQDLKKLEVGIPVQYIVGDVDFLNVNLEVNQAVLIPRFETEYFVERVLFYLDKYFKADCKMIDIGTGSGCIAIAIKKERPDLNVTAVDISKKALLLAEKNGRRNNCAINFKESDLLLDVDEKFDVIVSNPPYLNKKDKINQKVVDFEPKKALFAKGDGLEFYYRILTECHPKIADKCLIAFEIGDKQAKMIKKMALTQFPNSIVIIEKDLQKRERFIFLLKKC